jgi:hypothetical protein
VTDVAESARAAPASAEPAGFRRRPESEPESPDCAAWRRSPTARAERSEP